MQIAHAKKAIFVCNLEKSQWKLLLMLLSIWAKLLVDNYYLFLIYIFLLHEYKVMKRTASLITDVYYKKQSSFSLTKGHLKGTIPQQALSIHLMRGANKHRYKFRCRWLVFCQFIISMEEMKFLIERR